MAAEPFRVGEVVGWFEPDIPHVRLLTVDMDTGLFRGEFRDQPGTYLEQDIESICHLTPAYERWCQALLHRFAENGIGRGDAMADARQRAWMQTWNEEPELWLALKREHPILGVE